MSKATKGPDLPHHDQGHEGERAGRTVSPCQRLVCVASSHGVGKALHSLSLDVYPWRQGYARDPTILLGGTQTSWQGDP